MAAPPSRPPKPFPTSPFRGDWGIIFAQIFWVNFGEKGKIRNFSGAFFPTFSVALAVERCPPKRANRQEARARKTPGADSRKTTRQRGRQIGTAARLWPPAPRRWRRKTGCQQGGQPRRKGFYAPGIVSWEFDIYAPIAPPTGRRLTAPTRTGTGQGQSLQPAGQPHSPPQVTASRRKPITHRAEASRSQRQAHSLQPTATQQSPQRPARRPAGAAASKRPRLIPTKRTHARIKTRPRPRRYSRRTWKDCGCGGAKYF